MRTQDRSSQGPQNTRGSGHGLGQRGRAVFLFALWVVCAASAAALNPNRFPTQYGHDGWNFQNGLPGGAVYSVFQPTDGYIWLREASGLLRFDGVRFVPVAPRVGAEWVEENIRAVNLTTQGELLVRTASRTLTLKADGFHDVVPPAKLIDGMDRVVFRDRNGGVWIGSDSNVWRCENGQLLSVAEAVGWVSAIMQDRQGAVWIATGAGLYRVLDQRITVFPTGYNAKVARTALPTETILEGTRIRSTVTALVEDRSGVLWVGTNGGLAKVISGKIVEDEETEALKGRLVSTLLQDRDGNLWVGTDGTGLFRLSAGKWMTLRSEDGLSDNAICTLFEDVEGSLWVGTRSGLDRFRDTPLVTIGQKEGLAQDSAAAITEGLDGTVYVYTTEGSITQVRDGRCEKLTAAERRLGDISGAMYVARDGTLWLGTEHGLSSYRDGVVTAHPDDGTISGFYISSIHEDDEGILVATSQLALHRYKGGVFQPYDVPVPSGRGKESARYVCEMHRDEQGTLWLGMTAGLYRVERGAAPETARRTAFKAAVYSLYDDGEGSLWITGPDTRGFARFYKAENRVIEYGPDAGIPAGDIGRIVSDRHGDLWLGTRIGIIRVTRQGLDDYAAGKIQTVHPRVYGIVDGMKTEEAASNDRQPSAWRASDGRLYFATRKGLVVVDPDHLPINQRPPPVIIEECIVDKHETPKGGPIELSPGVENLEFHYTALSLLAPSRVRFKYQLDGYENTWVEAGSRRTAYYTHLPPGRYRFRVIAANEDGVWNETGATLDFTLRPHFYQTTWFYAVCVAGVGLSSVGATRLWTRRLRRRQTELVALVDERTHKLRSEVAERTQAQQELQKYREYLEQLVAERTAALQESNLRLKSEVAERRAGETALRLSEDRYRRFFEEDLAAAFIATPSGQLLTCNPSFARLFGFSNGAAAAGLELASFFQRPEEAATLLERVRRSGKAQDCELELKRRDGRPVYALATLVGSADHQGELSEVKGYLVDTTDRMRLENQLRQAQKMEAVGRLAGGVAHDFNNLLTAIIGSSECLIEDPGTAQETIQLAKEIRDAGQRAAALTRQLLAFSRKQVLQPKVINLNEIVANIEKMLRRLIGEDIQLEEVLAPDLDLTRADPNQIEQIIMNLAVNARDALPPGGRLSLRTFNAVLAEPLQQGAQVVPPGRYVCLQVQDNGCGMTPEVQARIFEPFFTTKGPGKGSGLGLSTVYGIVQQSNGFITFASEADRGTTFCVYLPVVSDEARESRGVSRHPLQTVGGREKILLVEDNVAVLKIAQRCLELAGFQVTSVSSAHEALRQCRAIRGAIDLLISDLIMPKMNGAQLAREITNEFPKIKVLFMSGYSDDVLERVGNFAQAPLIEKPFTPEALIRRVRETLDRKP